MPTRKRLPAFDADLYERRNQVERFLSKLKHFRAVAARYDKGDDNFLASVQLASLRIWLRTYESKRYSPLPVFWARSATPPAAPTVWRWTRFFALSPGLIP